MKPMIAHTLRLLLLSVLCFQLSGFLIPQIATAAVPFDQSALAFISTAASSTAETCTDNFPESEKEGILTQVIDYIKEIVDQATQDLYEGITGNQSYVSAVNAAITLMVTLFGVMFMFGVVQFSMGQALIRLFKIAIIFAMINEGFAFFSEYVVRLFNDGTDELINAVIGIATGGSSGGTSASGSPQPFRNLDGVVEKALSSQMMISIIGSFFEGPTGPAMGGLLMLGVIAFVRAVVNALRVYCIALIAKALLFGLAPIFVSFLLFDRTKQMFTGWLNQIIFYSLSPLLMFAFISFFVILLQSALENILGVGLCWTDVQTRSGKTSGFKMWRHKDGSDISSSDWTWEGLAKCILEKGSGCPDFPISIIDILAFVILAHLAWRFSQVVEQIAAEIASTALILSRLSSGFSSYGKRAIQGASSPRA